MLIFVFSLFKNKASLCGYSVIYISGGFEYQEMLVEADSADCVLANRLIDDKDTSASKNALLLSLSHFFYDRYFSLKPSSSTLKFCFFSTLVFIITFNRL